MVYREKHNVIHAAPASRTLVRWLAPPYLAALAAYTLLAIVVTWPIVPKLTTGIVGEVGGVDAYQDAWNLWWNARALSHGQLPFWTPLLFYPQGVDMFWQTLGFAQGLIALPATLSLGPLAAFNLTELSSFVIGGFATFLFARHVTGSTPAALVGGAIFAFSPYHIDKIIEGNLPLASIHWLPCYVFALYLLLESPSWKRALASGLLLLWVSLGSWYYAMFCVLFTGCAVAIWALGKGWMGWLRTALSGSMPLVLWMIVLAPRLSGLVQTGDETLMDMRNLQAARSADLIDFVLPNPRHPLWGASIRAAHSAIYPDAIIWNVSLGWIGLVLGMVGIMMTWRRSWRWAALLAAMVVFALGPTLRVAGYHTGVPLPFTLIQNLPGLRAGQRPNHIAVLASLMLAILAAFGFGWLTRGYSSRTAWGLALAIVIAGTAIDGYGGSLPIVRRAIHPFYANLPPPDGALIPLPAYVHINRSDNLTPQMSHGWPILGGYVARPPAYPFATYTPGVRELQYSAPQPDDIVTPGWPELGRRALAAYAIRYITLDLTSQKDAYFNQVRAVIKDLGLGPPLVADHTLEAYAVPRSWQAQPLLFLGGGWQPIERQPGTSYHWRWMGESAEIRLYNPYDRPVIATLSMTAASYGEPRPLHLGLDGIPSWQVALQPDPPTTRQFVFLLEPGEHLLKLSAPAVRDSGRSGEAISVRVFQLNARFSAPL